MREELEVAAAAPEDTAGTELADLGPPAPRSPSRPGSPARGAGQGAAPLGRGAADAGDAAASSSAGSASAARPVSRKPRGFPGFFDFGGPYLGQFGADSAPSWTVDHLCTSSRDLDTKIAHIDSYKVMLK